MKATRKHKNYRPKAGGSCDFSISEPSPHGADAVDSPDIVAHRSLHQQDHLRLQMRQGVIYHDQDHVLTSSCNYVEALIVPTSFAFRNIPWITGANACFASTGRTAGRHTFVSTSLQVALLSIVVSMSEMEEPARGHGTPPILVRTLAAMWAMLIATRNCNDNLSYLEVDIHFLRMIGARLFVHIETHTSSSTVKNRPVGYIQDSKAVRV